MTEHKDLSMTFTVDNPPEEVFAAINNVRGWWSQAIEGETDKLGAEFKYHYQDVHRCTFKISEWVVGKKVVWQVVDNYFNFVKDKTEWIGTEVSFEIARKANQTEVHFRHLGLVPAYGCYNVCSEAWNSYITGSLRNLITSGKGQPNPLEEIVSKARQMSGQNYTVCFKVDQSPEEVFRAVNNVRGWWSEEIEGETDKLGAEFKFRSRDFHRSTQKITELVPGQKVVWQVLDSQLNFVKDTTEWQGTEIVFEISRKEDDKTELRFTHFGLVPAFECYGECSNAWGYYIQHSLFDLITKGKGEPSPKEQVEEAQLVEQ
jgi:uncharacterized protein YndB with AHSA1/START domain